MKSKTSLYNFALSKSLFKRFWPLWVIWFWILVFVLPINLSTEIGNILKHGSFDAAFSINSALINYGISLVCFAAVICPLTVLLLFSFLYTSRSSGMIASLPIKRECVFTTCFLTGLVPLLLAELVTVLVTVVLCGGSGLVDNGVLTKCLWMLIFSTVAFYGMAVFCAMLTGNLIVVPVVYVVLNLAVYILESAVQILMELFIYGYSGAGGYVFTWLSPLVKLDELTVNRNSTLPGDIIMKAPVDYRINNVGVLAVYCAAGAVLLVLAALLYRRRQMETAGDLVSVKVLRPVFKYSMAVGAALVFACGVEETVLWPSGCGGLTPYLTMLALLIGALLGYFASEMLMQKTLRVFRGGWRGYFICALVLLVLALGCEFDLFGYEKRVPDAGNVEYAELSFSNTGDITQPENIEAYTQLHRQIIAHKKQNESCPRRQSYSLPISYRLKDGSRLTRYYSIDASPAALADPDSDINRWQALMNTDEIRAIRCAFTEPLSKDSFVECFLVMKAPPQEDTVPMSIETRLDSDAAAELYYDCILPDSRDGHIGDYFVSSCGEYYDTKTNVTVYYQTKDLNKETPYLYNHIEFVVQVDSERCLRWLKENTLITPVPLREVTPPDEAEYHILY